MLGVKAKCLRSYLQDRGDGMAGPNERNTRMLFGCKSVAQIRDSCKGLVVRSQNVVLLVLF